MVWIIHSYLLGWGRGLPSPQLESPHLYSAAELRCTFSSLWASQRSAVKYGAPAGPRGAVRRALAQSLGGRALAGMLLPGTWNFGNKSGPWEVSCWKGGNPEKTPTDPET